MPADRMANPIVRFLAAFAVYALTLSALVLAVDGGWYLLAYALAVAALAALTWCVAAVFRAVGYDPH